MRTYFSFERLRITILYETNPIHCAAAANLDHFSIWYWISIPSSCSRLLSPFDSWFLLKISCSAHYHFKIIVYSCLFILWSKDLKLGPVLNLRNILRIWKAIENFFQKWQITTINNCRIRKTCSEIQKFSGLRLKIRSLVPNEVISFLFNYKSCHTSDNHHVMFFRYNWCRIWISSIYLTSKSRGCFQISIANISIYSVNVEIFQRYHFHNYLNFMYSSSY